MTINANLGRLVLLSAAIASLPAMAQRNGREAPTPVCIDFAYNPAWGLAGNPDVTDVTAVIAPAAGNNLAYCQVDFTDISLEGSRYGYMHGQTSKFRIRVGLPLNRNDGGTGGVQGAWNGNVRSNGNGGFAGNVSGVTSATNLGYVGTGTDTGHNAAITNAVPNPGGPFATVQVPPSESGATFGLNPDGTVNYGRIKDWAWRGQHHANLWGRHLAEMYYGRKHDRNYFVGCSDGGREGHEMAQRYGDEFDGIVSISPAIYWDRWGFSAGWGRYVANQLLGQNGLEPAKFTDVTQRAIEACDPIDGIVDGMIQESRLCKYNAEAAVCGQPGASTNPAVCLTPLEAEVVNQTWEGPRDPQGNKLWVGWERGTPNVISGVTGSPSGFGEGINRYWVHRDPFFDWRTIDMSEFMNEQLNITRQFSSLIGSDSTNLREFKRNGGKMIVSYGNRDATIPPNGHYNYVQRLFDDMGGVLRVQDFYRYYMFPNAGHCSGAGMTESVLFNALTNWVENGVEPDHLVAQVNPTRTRKVCMYPNTPRYIGTGSTDDEANFVCQVNPQDNRALLRPEARILQGDEPVRNDNDINKVPVPRRGGR